MRAILVLILLLSVVPPSSAENKYVTCRGKLIVGSSDSAIDGLSCDCVFLSDSAVASRVFTTCSNGEDCEIVGVINGYGTLTEISYIRMIDINTEPSSKYIKIAACFEAGIDAETCGNSPGIYLDIVHSSTFMDHGDVVWSYVADVRGSDGLGGNFSEKKRVTIRLVKQDGGWTSGR